VYDRDGAKLDVPAGVEPGCGPVFLRVTVGRAVAGALARCDPGPKRGFGSLSVAGALAKCDASATGPSRPG
jgi:hypothetical protein